MTEQWAGRYIEFPVELCERPVRAGWQEAHPVVSAQRRVLDDAFNAVEDAWERGDDDATQAAFDRYRAARRRMARFEGRFRPLQHQGPVMPSHMVNAMHERIMARAYENSVSRMLEHMQGYFHGATAA